MDCNILADFRRTLYACFQKAGDALMNLADALLTETPARSLAELSLSPCFERRWPSLYEALEDAKIDRVALHKLFADQVPAPAPGQRLVLGGDASSIFARRVKDRPGSHLCTCVQLARRHQARPTRLAVLDAFGITRSS